MAGCSLPGAGPQGLPVPFIHQPWLFLGARHPPPQPGPGPGRGCVAGPGGAPRQFSSADGTAAGAGGLGGESGGGGPRSPQPPPTSPPPPPAPLSRTKWVKLRSARMGGEALEGPRRAPWRQGPGPSRASVPPLRGGRPGGLHPGPQIARRQLLPCRGSRTLLFSSSRPLSLCLLPPRAGPRPSQLARTCLISTDSLISERAALTPRRGGGGAGGGRWAGQARMIREHQGFSRPQQSPRPAPWPGVGCTQTHVPGWMVCGLLEAPTAPSSPG